MHAVCPYCKLATARVHTFFQLAQTMQVNNDCKTSVRTRTFFRSATSVQSKDENKPPHTAKLPPILGASRLIAWKHPQGVQLLIVFTLYLQA